MKYKFELITDLQKLATRISATEEKLFILKNDRDDAAIRSKSTEKASTKHAAAKATAQQKLNEANASYDAMAEGPKKAKQQGVILTLQASVYKLNLPVETKSPDEVVDHEVDKGELDALIVFYEDVLDHLNQRLTQIQNGG